jgi:hypothetical protein
MRADDPNGQLEVYAIVGLACGLLALTTLVLLTISRPGLMANTVFTTFAAVLGITKGCNLMLFKSL